ncbi:MAG TPA: hypothetical protein VEK76_00410 [Candidatus Binatia bacterium]|nr:hypothetical protein [Candidatus Binatia bacterium]
MNLRRSHTPRPSRDSRRRTLGPGHPYVLSLAVTSLLACSSLLALPAIAVAGGGATGSSAAATGVGTGAEGRLLETSNGLPLTRAVGINLIGGHAGDQTPLSSIPGEIQDAAQNLHVSWVRQDFDWWRVNPTGGSTYDWSETDPVMAAAAKYGVGVVAILGSIYWPSSTPVVPSTTQWTAFVKAFVERYDSVWKPEGLKGLVVEPWNEPENNWNGTAAQWATQIQLPAYQAVKAVDPSVLVTLDTVDWAAGGQSWWQQVVSALAGQQFVDLPGFHDYANSAQSWAGSFRSFLNSHGVHYTAIWCTEFGVAMTPPVPHDDSTHITVLQSQIPPTLAGGGGPDAMFYYAYKDLAEGGVVHASYGLMDENGNHYQSYSVFQQLMGAAPAPTPAGPTPTPTPTHQPTPAPTPPVVASPSPSNRSSPAGTSGATATPTAGAAGTGTAAASPSTGPGSGSSSPTSIQASPSAPSSSPAAGPVAAVIPRGAGGGGPPGWLLPAGIGFLIIVLAGLTAIGVLRRRPPGMTAPPPPPDG